MHVAPVSGDPVSGDDAGAPLRTRASEIRAAAVGGEPLDLARADLRGVDLTSAPCPADAHGRPDARQGPTLVLDGANLRGAILSGARLTGVRLRHAQLEGALLVGADLRGADLRGACLRGAHISGADVRGAHAAFADLRGAALLTANLDGAFLDGANLREAVLDSATLRGASLVRSDLRWARLVGCSLARACLDEASFEGANLACADLSAAHLSDGTSLSYTFLRGARFDRSEVRSTHVGPGVGEIVTDVSAARDTYLRLSAHFEDSGWRDDATWARLQAERLRTA